jgi:hypothetical protein
MMDDVEGPLWSDFQFQLFDTLVSFLNLHFETAEEQRNQETELQSHFSLRET